MRLVQGLWLSDGVMGGRSDGGAWRVQQEALGPCWEGNA